jgi:hypothetical protein
MKSNTDLEARDALFQLALSKLYNCSDENVNILVNHLFHLKVNDDFVINSERQVEDLVAYINENE